MNSKKGFTIVEVVVVVAVICLITVLAVLNIGNIQSRARDASRSAKITIIAESLEKYFSKNGEYPGCTAMSQTPQTVTTNTLTGMNADALTSPSDASGTNSILGSCADLTVGTDKFAYIGDGSATCLTGAYCTRYTLKYYKEEANTVMMQNSRKGQITPTNPITAIGAISGTAQMGQTLTAGAITPADATVNYQWQKATTSGGTYTDISGATNSTYTPTLADAGKYLKVTATATGIYTGTQASAASSQIATDSSWRIVGNQVWASTNLNVGTLLSNSDAQTNNGVVEKHCYGSCNTYGGLYKWNEAMQYSTTENTQGICPTNSHIPSDNDWKVLELYLGMTQAQADNTGERGTDQGTKLKFSGSSGINIPLAGFISYDGTSLGGDSNAYLWSSTQTDSTTAVSRGVSTTFETVSRYTTSNKSGSFSIRCIGN